MEQSEPVNMSGTPRLRVFVAGAVSLALLFALPLYDWVRLAVSVDLHSHVILIPLISGYLIWRKREHLSETCNSAWWVASLFGLGSLGLVWVAWRWGAGLETQDDVALTAGAYVMGVIGLGFACFGWKTMQTLAFPFFVLVFMVPLPSGIEMVLEQFLQRLSADAAHLLFWMFGETFLRDGQVFLLPGLTIRVAQECSGIRSSLVLFILSLLAAHLMLRSSWRRAVLVLAVIPLGILRNGLRVYLISALTVHVNPEIINSPLHHRGGPLFFALSLLPFGLLLWILLRSERRAAAHMVKESSQ